MEKDCVLIEQHNNITGVNVMITSTELYIPVVTLSINDNITFLENLKQVFKKTSFWNKYRSEITTHPKSRNLNYLIDPAFKNIKRLLFFHSKMKMMIVQGFLLMSITCH